MDIFDDLINVSLMDLTKFDTEKPVFCEALSLQIHLVR